MVGSVDRHAQPDQPDPAGRPDAAREQPKSPCETDAQRAERLGLPTLTRASAYESLYARATAQDAPFRERLAREEAAGKRESLSEAGESRAPQDPSKPPIDKPERDLETTRSYWTEVPRFFTNWGRLADRWPARQQPDKESFLRNAERYIRDVLPGERLPERELPISDNVKRVERESSNKLDLAGFEFRLKSKERLSEKVAERLKREPDRSPDDIISTIHDAIRYTFCIDKKSYTSGFDEVKEKLEACGYEMYNCKNSWADPQYKGVNSRWITPEGQRFEVQFHTRESFHAKHEVTHLAYERLRQPGISPAERQDLMDFQRDVSRWIPIPDRVLGIRDHEKKEF